MSVRREGLRTRERRLRTLRPRGREEESDFIYTSPVRRLHSLSFTRTEASTRKKRRRGARSTTSARKKVVDFGSVKKLRRLTCKKLRGYLRKQGLDETGKKILMVQRLVDAHRSSSETPIEFGKAAFAAAPDLTVKHGDGVADAVAATAATGAVALSRPAVVDGSAAGAGDTGAEFGPDPKEVQSDTAETASPIGSDLVTASVDSVVFNHHDGPLATRPILDPTNTDATDTEGGSGSKGDDKQAKGFHDGFGEDDVDRQDEGTEAKENDDADDDNGYQYNEGAEVYHDDEETKNEDGEDDGNQISEKVDADDNGASYGDDRNQHVEIATANADDKGGGDDQPSTYYRREVADPLILYRGSGNGNQLSENTEAYSITGKVPVEFADDKVEACDVDGNQLVEIAKANEDVNNDGNQLSESAEADVIDEAYSDDGKKHVEIAEANKDDSKNRGDDENQLSESAEADVIDKQYVEIVEANDNDNTDGSDNEGNQLAESAEADVNDKAYGDDRKQYVEIVEANEDDNNDGNDNDGNQLSESAEADVDDEAYSDDRKQHVEIVEANEDDNTNDNDGNQLSESAEAGVEDEAYADDRKQHVEIVEANEDVNTDGSDNDGNQLSESAEADADDEAYGDDRKQHVEIVEANEDDHTDGSDNDRHQLSESAEVDEDDETDYDDDEIDNDGNEDFEARGFEGDDRLEKTGYENNSNTRHSSSFETGSDTSDEDVAQSIEPSLPECVDLVSSDEDPEVEPNDAAPGQDMAGGDAESSDVVEDHVDTGIDASNDLSQPKSATDDGPDDVRSATDDQEQSDRNADGGTEDVRKQQDQHNDAVETNNSIDDALLNNGFEAIQDKAEGVSTTLTSPEELNSSEVVDTISFDQDVASTVSQTKPAAVVTPSQKSPEEIRFLRTIQQRLHSEIQVEIESFGKLSTTPAQREAYLKTVTSNKRERPADFKNDGSEVCPKRKISFTPYAPVPASSSSPNSPNSPNDFSVTNYDKGTPSDTAYVVTDQTQVSLYTQFGDRSVRHTTGSPLHQRWIEGQQQVAAQTAKNLQPAEEGAPVGPKYPHGLPSAVGLVNIFLNFVGTFSLVLTPRELKDELDMFGHVFAVAAILKIIKLFWKNFPESSFSTVLEVFCYFFFVIYFVVHSKLLLSCLLIASTVELGTVLNSPTTALRKMSLAAISVGMFLVEMELNQFPIAVHVSELSYYGAISCCAGYFFLLFENYRRDPMLHKLLRDAINDCRSTTD